MKLEHKQQNNNSALHFHTSHVKIYQQGMFICGLDVLLFYVLKTHKE